MAAIRLFLKKGYKDLIIIDFICRGINSPKVFRKHLDSLEDKYGSEVVYVKAKNKEHGWRSLTFKAVFKNGEVYYGDGNEDDFTRGYLRTGYYCRPSCFDCKFKEIPRIADLTIADFWGAENVSPSLDDNKGTSLIMCNTAKGRAYFDSMGDRVKKQEISLSDVEHGNRSLYQSLNTSQTKRDDFFYSLNKMKFSDVAEKYFPKQEKKSGRMLSLLKSVVQKLLYLQKTMGFSPRVWCQFIWLNFLRRNTTSNIFKMHVFVPTRHCVFDIHPSANVVLNGLVTFGVTKVKGSRMESRLYMAEKTKLIVNDVFFTYADADIQIFTGGELTFEGGKSSGCNIHCQIVCADNIHVGRGTLIGRNVVLRDYDAHYIIQKGYKVKDPIMIGERCWIGDGALISKGVSVGDGSIVAARSWVISKVDEQMLVAGSPAMPMAKNIEWRA